MSFEKKLLIMLFISTLTGLLTAQNNYSEIASNTRKEIFIESFENNDNNWLTDNLWIRGVFADGRYFLTCKNYNDKTGISYRTVPIDYSRDFEIETSFRILKGTGAIVFGMTQNFEHTRLEINNKGNFAIIKDTPSRGKVQKIFTGSVKAFADANSFNKYTLRKYKGSFFFFINELMICNLNNIVLSGDQFGFSVGLSSEITVDFVNISYIDEPIKPLITENADLLKDTLSTNHPVAENIAQEDRSILSNQVNDHPLIKWTSPSAESTVYDLFSARVKASVESFSDLNSVQFFVNGSPKGEAERRSAVGESNTFVIEKAINLEPGENIVYFIATNEAGSTRSEDRYFINPEATKPIVTWSNPVRSNVIVSSDMLTIEACINSPSGLKSVKVMVNGESQGEDNLFQVKQGSDCNIIWQRPIILKEDVDNSIYVIATNNAGFTTSENRIIRYSKAVAEKRIALVIGNSNYGIKTPLKNPVQDANLMEATLKSLGFEVLKYNDLGLIKMREAVRDFSQKIKDFNVALFYYAGHGVQVDGQNFLIPVDAVLDSKDDCKWETFAVNDLMEEFEKNQDNINIAILDACRSNPFKSWVRGESQGFTPLTNTSGTFVSFATAPGSTAADGDSGNGLFTEELVKQMNKVQPISSVFLNTRINVYERSQHLQRPQEWNDLNGEFYFKK